LTERRARILMLQAFTNDVLEEVKVDALRDYLTEKVRDRFRSYFE
jgi:Fe-S cluster assembly protein SufD